MPTIRRFEDIHAWQSARELTHKIYTITNRGNFSNDFGLRDQVRRAAVSVMSNIAEGYESRTKRSFIDYLGRAKASAGEVRSQVYVAYDVGYLEKCEFDQLFELAESCSKQIANFIGYLEADAGKSS